MPSSENWSIRGRGLYLIINNPMLPREAIIEFKKIYVSVYGVQIDDAEAERRANNLVGFYSEVYGGNPRMDAVKINNHDEREKIKVY